MFAAYTETIRAVIARPRLVVVGRFGFYLFLRICISSKTIIYFSERIELKAQSANNLLTLDRIEFIQCTHLENKFE